MVRFNHERIDNLLIEHGFKKVNLFWRRGNDTVFRLNGMSAYLFINGKKDGKQSETIICLGL